MVEIVSKSKERALSTPGNCKPNLNFLFVVVVFVVFFFSPTIFAFLHFLFINRVAQTRENEEKLPIIHVKWTNHWLGIGMMLT